MNRLMLFGVFSGLFLLGGSAFCGEDAAQIRFPSGHPDAGLPVSAAPMAVYHSDTQHSLNRLHQMLFVVEVTPEEINGTLPRELEAGTDSAKPWYFRKRGGNDQDRKFFGGDVRISPLVSWPEEQTASFLSLADELLASGDAQPAFGLKPLSCLMLQWDLLSVWWRLEQQAGTPSEVLFKLAQLIVKTAQPEERLTAIPSGYENARTQFADANSQFPEAPYFSADNILARRDGWVELSRRSTKLFVAPQSLRSSRVFLKLPPDGDLAAWMNSQSVAAEHPEKRPPERIETAMTLSLIGITPELKPVATPAIDEIRFRTVFAAEEKIDPARTTTRDGSTIWLYFIDRSQTFANSAARYRFIAPDTQSIFLEYGSAKHSSYAAQCSLCHRLTNSGNQTIAGVRTLSKIASATVTENPADRLRLAELQMEVVTNRLKQRLESQSQTLPAATFDYSAVPDRLP